MKGAIKLILFILVPYFALGQFYYEINDTLMVVANNGLTIRDQPSLQANKISSIPFGKGIIAKSLPSGTELIEDRSGGWIEIEYDDYSGYVFSGYLTRAKVPLFSKEKYCKYKSQYWWVELIKANCDTLLCSGSRTYKDFDPDRGGRRSTWEMYSNETIVYRKAGYEYADVVVETNEFNMNDILNLLEYFISQIQDCEGSYYEYRKRVNPLKAEIAMDGNGEYERIKTISCMTFGFKAERSLNKTMFSVMLE